MYRSYAYNSTSNHRMKKSQKIKQLLVIRYLQRYRLILVP